MQPVADVQGLGAHQGAGVVVQAILRFLQCWHRLRGQRRGLGYRGRRREFDRPCRGRLALGDPRKRRVQCVDGRLRRAAGTSGAGENGLQLAFRQRLEGVGRAAIMGPVERDQQAVDGVLRRPVAGGVAAFAQHDLGEVVGRMAIQETGDDRRQVTPAAAARKLGGDGGARMLQPLSAALGFRTALLRQLEPPAMLRKVLAQLLLQGLENGHVLVELRHQPVDGLVDAAQQLALLRRFAMVAFAGLGHGIEQAARRMFLVQEQPAILHCDLDVGHQHPPDHAPDVGVVLRAVKEHVEQQRNQVHRVAVQPVEVQVVARHAQLARALRHLLAQLGGQRPAIAGTRHRHGRGGVALHQRQH